MDKSISKKMRALLLHIAPHEGKIGYLLEFFDGLSSDDAWEASRLLYGLIDAGLVDVMGDKAERAQLVEVDGKKIERTYALRPTFLLTADGAAYIDGLPSKRIREGFRIASDILAVLGSVAAIVNLILYIIWTI